MLSGTQWWLWSGYIERVRAVAPPVLVGRQAELAELAEWCRGDEPTVVWRGGLSGDVTGDVTELLSWFALHPPEGTWVVSYFDGESAGSHSPVVGAAWTMRDALIDQLSAIVGPPQSELDTDRARQLPQLLDWVVQQGGYSGRRLVLVLASGDPDSSQASWIPGSVRPDLRVIVAARADAEPPGEQPEREAVAAAGDLNQLIEIATDLGRDDRLLDLPGGPAAILAEVCAAQEALGRQSEPGLAAALKLSVRRAGLRARPVSVRLASVWAVLGNVARGLALARDIADLGESWEAVIGVARGVAGGGDSALAEAIVRWVDDSEGEESGQYSLGELVCRVTAAWDLQWAESVAQSLPDGESRQTALAAVQKAVAQRGLDDGISTRADTEWPEIRFRHPGLEELFRTGDHAAAFAEAGRLHVTDERIRELVKVAAALDRAGEHDRAVEAAAQAEADLGTVYVPLYKSSRPAVTATARAEAADIVARTWAALGDRERAEAVVRTITREPIGAADGRRFPFDPFDQAEAMIQAAGKVLEAGDRERAADLVTRAESVARVDDRLLWRAETLALVAQAWLALGDRTRAESAAHAASVPPVPTADELKAEAGIPVTGTSKSTSAMTVAAAVADARLIASPRQRVEALASVIKTTTDGELRAQLAAEAAAIIGAVAQDDVREGFDRALAIVAAVEALVEVGALDLAELVVDTVREPAVRAESAGTENRVKALVIVATARAESGDGERAAQLAAEAEELARTLTRPNRLAHGLAIATTAWAAAKDRGRAARLAVEAEAIARAVEEEHWRGHALADVIEAMLAIGEREQAATLALTVPKPNTLGREEALIAVVEAMVAAGEQEQARALARSFTTPFARRRTLIAVGDFAGAAEAASRETEPEWRATCLADVVEATARAGRMEEAEELAQSIDVSTQRGRALAAIAEHCSNPADTRRLLVQALAIGDWVEPLKVLARIDPAAARAAAEACG